MILRFLALLSAAFFALGYAQRTAEIREAEAEASAAYLRLP